MGIILWIIFGGVAGWIASMIMNTNGNQGMIKDIVLGIVGGLVGGYVMVFFGQGAISGFNLYSLGVAVLGAVIIIYLGRMVKL